MMNEILGRRIRELRTIRNLTQEQMARLLNISRQKYSRIESGMNSISLEILVKIADILDVSVNDITKVLDQEPLTAYRNNNVSGKSSDGFVFDMLDFFYANKHMYRHMQDKEEN